MDPSTLDELIKALEQAREDFNQFTADNLSKLQHYRAELENPKLKIEQRKLYGKKVQALEAEIDTYDKCVKTCEANIRNADIPSQRVDKILQSPDPRAEFGRSPRRNYS